ncbi:MAG: hypothetical protein ACOYNS_03325 [Bacteroidota bacterium]
MVPARSFTNMVSVFLLCSIVLFGQEAEPKQESLYIMASAAVGNFTLKADKEFRQIYSNSTLTKNFAAGLGTRSMVLIAKYREFSATGRSTVTNIDQLGKAEWKQKFYEAGVRIRGDEIPLYLDLLYVSTRADEMITTESPVIARLTASSSKESKGIGGAVGISLKLAGMIRIFAEAEYCKLAELQIDLFGRPSPELGGTNLSAGIQLSF